MKTSYFAKLDRDTTDRFALTIPDLPGFVFESEHNNINRACAEAEALLADYLAAMRDNNREIPIASTPQKLSLEYPDNGWILLNAIFPTGKITRTMISMDETELEMIDRKAKERGMTRSGFIVSAARAA